MRMVYGTSVSLEKEANKWLKRSIAGVKSYSAKSDILTPWKEQMRHTREIHNVTGVADTTRKGMYHRRANVTRPELNSRMGTARPRKNPGGTLGAFLAETGRRSDDY